MDESTKGFGNGILKGLKRVLFTSAPEQASNTAYPADPNSIPTGKPPLPNQKMADSPMVKSTFPIGQSLDMDNGTKDMKLRVYQLLEQINRPGVDFFEVWNAAVEMGGANANNLKSAFTSLRFADKLLDKSRLVESGNGYVKELEAVFETEAKKRQQEKAMIAAEKEEVRKGLTSEIENLQVQIIELQNKMESQQQKLLVLDEHYNPQLQAIEQKIKNGSDAVKSVLAEMQQVLQIINKEIN